MRWLIGLCGVVHAVADVGKGFPFQLQFLVRVPLRLEGIALAVSLLQAFIRVEENLILEFFVLAAEGSVVWHHIVVLDGAGPLENGVSVYFTLLLLWELLALRSLLAGGVICFHVRVSLLLLLVPDPFIDLGL